MRKKIALFLMLLSSCLVFSQEETIDSLTVLKDSIVYNKNIDFASKKAFKEDLKTKYSDEDFIYTEEVEEKKEEETAPLDPAFIAGLSYFMSSIFPFLLGGIIIFIILKSFLGSETGFWNFKKNKKVVSKKLIYEDDDIHEIDLQTLLQEAIQSKNYRLAIRYYYLTVLKGLSQKKMINYHKDKTNTAYLFEIENTAIRKEFKYLSYVYTYVWYGEFSVDETKFKTVETKYKSFIKNTI